MKSEQENMLSSNTTHHDDKSNNEDSTKKENTAEDMKDTLKRYRGEVGYVGMIPDTWGHEHLLNDWIDCSTFDFQLVPNGIVSARASLAQQQQKQTSEPLSGQLTELGLTAINPSSR